MKRLLLSLCLLFFLGNSRSDEAVAPADALVRQVMGEVLLQLGAPGFIEDRRQVHAFVQSRILPHFALNDMTRRAMGKYWKEAGAAQQQALTQEFGELLANSFTRILQQYQGQKVIFLPRSATDDAFTVQSEITEPGEMPVFIDYRLEKIDGSWEVYDVVIDHLSLIRIYRVSFAQEILQGGITGLLAVLHRKNQQAALP